MPSWGLSSYVGSYDWNQASIHIPNRVATVSIDPNNPTLLNIAGFASPIAKINARWIAHDNFAANYEHNNTHIMLSCTAAEALSIQNALVKFERDSSGNIVSFSIPGVGYLDLLHKKLKFDFIFEFKLFSVYSQCLPLSQVDRQF